MGREHRIECQLVLHSSSLPAAVRWGLALAIAVTFGAAPLPALGGDLMALNQDPKISADDPRIPLTPPPPVLPPSAAPKPVAAHEILVQAAKDQGVDPNLLLAVSFWESGWRQDQVSSEGAVGLLQVMPKTALTAGPRLLHRAVNIQDPHDNAEVGAALLRDLLNKYDTRTALAAYYQGEPALLSGHYARDTWRYADGILTLKARIAAGKGPEGPATN
jgi:soluble lytic murein transglycosylase-like protein